MKPYWENGRAALYQGHVLDVLKGMESQSVHMCVTSPPYWGLRDYQLPPIEWPAVSYAPMAGLAEIEVPGCWLGCPHEWGEEQRRVMTGGGTESSTLGVLSGGHGMSEDGHKRTLERSRYDASQGQYCQRCGGWRGSLGLEPTVEAYVGHLVLVCRELKRVLRDDGCFFLNLGDSYFGDSPTRTRSSEAFSKEWDKSQTASRGGLRRSAARQNGLKPKDLIGVPWRVALALQADGWWLRSAIIWAKGVSFCPTYSGSCMPESCRDRPTSSYEHVFLLAKSKTYFYDNVAVRENYTESGLKRQAAGRNHMWGRVVEGDHRDDRDREDMISYAPSDLNPAGRNLRSVWTINPGNFPGSHFATFPPKLVEPMIRAGTSQPGVCPKCKAPHERVTEKVVAESKDCPKTVAAATARGGRGKTSTVGQSGGGRIDGSVTTTGWSPTCACDDGDPVPATVLDIFGGSGTTAEVSIRLGRKVMLIELSKTYCDDHIIPRLSAGLQMELPL